VARANAALYAFVAVVDKLVQDLMHLGCVQRFGHKARTVRFGKGYLRRQRRGGKDDNGNVPPTWMMAQLPQSLPSRHARHIDVHNDEARGVQKGG
jgi:hypothetical protein